MTGFAGILLCERDGPDTTVFRGRPYSLKSRPLHRRVRDARLREASLRCASEAR